MNILKLDCDVLIIGSGLSGLRAAITASEYAVKTVLIDFYKGPSGSSFVNLNKRLGMQVLRSDEEKEHFVKRTVEIASPGEIDVDLVKIMAEESEKRYFELKEFGAIFEKQENSICRYPGCFDPVSKTAVIIKNLPELYKNLYLRIKDKIKILKGWLLIKLLKDPLRQKICGGVFINENFTDLLFIKSKSVVMATGGCTGLFLWSISPQKPSFGLGLLKDVGARLCNERFVQFMWVEKESKEFFSFEKISSLKIINKKEKKIPEDLLPLIKERTTHCPIGYHLKDFEIDKFLLTHLTKEGVKVKIGDRITHLIPVAQAQNGGALIDKRSMTSVSGLFACGECASGMHGANRIGGAMVLATQVFGHRAGKYSSIWAKENDFLSDKLFTQLINDFKILIPSLSKNNFIKPFGLDLNFRMIKYLLLENTEDLNELLKVIDVEVPHFISKLKLNTLKTMLSVKGE